MVPANQKGMNSDLKKVASVLCACPTAPYHEFLVRAAALRLLHNLSHVTTRLDAFGNVVIHYRHRPRPGAAFALVAHLDHPGFVGDQFFGGVAEAYFPGQRVALFHPQTGRRLGHRIVKKTDFTKDQKKITWDQPVPAEAIGLWDLPVDRFTRTHFHSRACDDLVGASTLVALIRHLAQTQARADVSVLLTRAEEVGFHGALAALTGKPPFPKIPVLSLETSQARGFAQQGAGPIIRVGDRTSIFDSSVTHWLHSAAGSLLTIQRNFKSQRLLMGGGTCEGTVFQAAGYPTGALCLALGHYHNMGPRHRIAAENVHLGDWQNLFLFLIHLAVQADSRTHTTRQLQQRIQTLRRTGVRALKKYPLPRDPFDRTKTT